MFTVPVYIATMGTEPYNVVPGKGMAPNTIVVSAEPSPLYIQVRGFDTLPW
jgi:hypothetical protein